MEGVAKRAAVKSISLKKYFMGLFLTEKRGLVFLFALTFITQLIRTLSENSICIAWVIYQKWALKKTVLMNLVIVKLTYNKTLQSNLVGVRDKRGL